MRGVNTSQARGEDLQAEGFEVYVCPETGFWVRTDNISREKYTYKVYKTGDAGHPRYGHQRDLAADPQPPLPAAPHRLLAIGLCVGLTN